MEIIITVPTGEDVAPMINDKCTYCKINARNFGKTVLSFCLAVRGARPYC